MCNSIKFNFKKHDLIFKLIVYILQITQKVYKFYKYTIITKKKKLVLFQILKENMHSLFCLISSDNNPHKQPSQMGPSEHWR